MKRRSYSTSYSIRNTEGIKLENRSDMDEEYKKYHKTEKPDDCERIIEE